MAIAGDERLRAAAEAVARGDWETAKELYERALVYAIRTSCPARLGREEPRALPIGMGARAGFPYPARSIRATEPERNRWPTE